MVLGAMLVVLLCGVVAVGLYLILGRSEPGQIALSASQMPPPVITQVVTDAPGQVVTMVVASPTEPPIPEPVSVRVAPDGSGDYANLEAAIEAVPPGSTIQLDPGTYQLAGSLEIEKSLILQGAGMDETLVTGSQGTQVVFFSGPGSFAAQDIAFRYEGSGPARVMTVDVGEIDIARCRFSGGIWSESEKMGGNGLLLRGNTTGSIHGSHFEANGLSGLELQDQVQVLLEDNVFKDNGKSGLIYFDDSGGTARRNESTGNGLHGIEVREQARPSLEGNTCTQNVQDGVAYFEQSGGVALQNTCSDNGLHGIGVNEEAQPTLEENVCENNASVGIRFSGSSSGTARNNHSTGNQLHGLAIRNEAQPILEGNTCVANAQDGIAYFEQSGGVARENRCAENGLHGISVNEDAHPTLEDNVCENNTEAGIRFADNSGGTVRGNTCTGNGLHGFHLGEQADPTLEDNISNNNVEGGLVYFDEASGVARENVCIGNKWGIHVVETANPELVNNDCRENSKADIDDQRISPEPGFGPITFAKDRTEENDPIDPTNVFPAGTTEIHALFDFEGMSADIEWSRTWYRDGEERVAKTQNWTGDERGTWGLRYYNTDGNPLKSGNYELQLTIGDNLVQSATFVIQP
jgi:parallel beta-helix repeat protein